MKHQVQVYEVVGRGAGNERLLAAGGFEVDGATPSHARAAAQVRLEEEGRPVRTLAFSLRGELIAIVHGQPALVVESGSREAATRGGA